MDDFVKCILNSHVADYTMAADGKASDVYTSTEEVASSIVESTSGQTQRLSEMPGSEEGGYNEAKNPFRDPAVAQRWREAYEKSSYECRHVFDPSLSWSEEEERRLVRKLDWRVCLWAVSRSYRPYKDTGSCTDENLSL
ncbi:hypothetical protein V8C37DRAFT_364737 [Trichoderma ceciliae]